MPRLKAGAEIHSDRRLPALTGLRIFAALAVYGSHVGAPHNAPTVLKTFMASGYSGVTIFFVLSGFVLSINYFQNLRTLRPTRIYNYFVARFARVYPLYVLLLFYVVVRQHAFGESIDGWWRNALAIQAWDPDVLHAYSFVGPSWSISVEFFLYACFPLLIPLIARLHRPRAIALVGLAVAAAMAALAAWFVVTGKGNLPVVDPDSAHRWLYRTPLTRLGDFVLGILAARLFVEIGGRRAVGQIGRLLVVGSGVLLVALMAWPALLDSAWSWDVAYAIPATLLIFGLAIAPLSWPAKALSLPFVVLLGEASYAFYLVHSLGISFLGAGRWTVAMSPTALVYEALALGAIVVLSIGLHIAVERPARTRLRQWLSRSETRRQKSKSPEPATQGSAA
jgi:peptidoglycan/LPS O-acetylase OafA/YrhL